MGTRECKNNFKANHKLEIIEYPGFDDPRWKQVEGFADYYVHPEGFVKSVKSENNKRTRTRTVTQRILSIFTVQGYASVNLIQSNPYKRISARIHILVAHAFLGNRPDGCDVMHLDGDAANPCLSNLRYGSRKCNEAFKIDHGTALIGEKHHQAKLTSVDVIEIRKKLEIGMSGVKIAEQYKVTPSAISCINRGITWDSV